MAHPYTYIHKHNRSLKVTVQGPALWSTLIHIYIHTYIQVRMSIFTRHQPTMYILLIPNTSKIHPTIQALPKDIYRHDIQTYRQHYKNNFFFIFRGAGDV
jgi:hypothetical protein